MTRQNAIQTQQQQAASASPLSRIGMLQRQCESCGQHTIAGGECRDCGKKKQLPLQRRTTNQSELDEIPSVVHEVLKSPGQALDSETRNFMEQRFGNDFSQVRVHTDAVAARQLKAAAFTVGSDIVFGSGTYSPKTKRGKQLIAHELVHVLQHRANPVRADAPIASANRAEDASERQADSVGTQVALGLSLDGWMPIAPISLLSLAPETWYRGEVEGVAPISSSRVEGGHDLGDGLYLSDDVSVAKTYADTRLDENNRLNQNKLLPTAKRLLATELDPPQMGRVLDLTKDDRWQKFLEKPFRPGASQTNGELIKIQRNYNSVFQDFCRQNNIKVEDYHIIIGPETVRSGKQMCIRDPKLITQVRNSFVPVRPSGGGRGSGSGNGGEPEAETSEAKRSTSGGGRGSGSGNGGESEAETSEAKRGTLRAGGLTTESEIETKPGTQGRTAPDVPSNEEADPQTGRSRRSRSQGGASRGAGTGLSPLGMMMLHLGSGAALGLFDSWFKDKVARDLDALPKPKIDTRGAESFLKDPKTADGVHLLDLFNKNMKPFQKELDDHHQLITTSNNLRLMALALKHGKTTKDFEDRLQELSEIDSNLSSYNEMLLTVEKNLDVILENEDRALQAKKAADDLRELLKSGFVIDWLFHRGFSVEEIADMDNNLNSLSASISILFNDTRITKHLIAQLREKAAILQDAAKTIYWKEFYLQIQQNIKEIQAQRLQTAESSKKKNQKNDLIKPREDKPVEPTFHNADEMGTYYGLRTRESEIMIELERLEIQSHADERAVFEKRNELLNELNQVRDRMKRYQQKKG